MTNKIKISDTVGKNNMNNDNVLVGEVQNSFSDMSEKNRIYLLMGSMQRSALFSRIGWVTETRDLMEIRKLFNSKDPVAMGIAPNFKSFCKLIGRDYSTVSERIKFLYNYEMETCEYLESAGFTIRDLRLFGELSKDQQESVKLLISNGHVDESVKEAVRNMAAENIRLKDRLNEAELKTKVELIEERKRAQAEKKNREYAYIEAQEKIERQNERIKRLLDARDPGGRLEAMRKTDKHVSTLLEIIEKIGDLDDDSPEFEAEKAKLRILFSRALELLKI